MDKTCKTCKWWMLSTFSDFMRSIGYGDCYSEKFIRDYWVLKEELINDGVWVEDLEGRAFSPGPDFGCIHHEEKER